MDTIRLYVRKMGDVWFGVAADDNWIFATTFANEERRVLIKLMKALPFNVPFTFNEKTSKLAEKAISMLNNIYSGEDESPADLPINMHHLSGYMNKVLQSVAKIPLGYVASYSAVAKVAGGSARSVGRVMAENPFMLVIPCHRVVAADFSLGGYGEGLNVKLEILNRERRGCTAERRIRVNKGYLHVHPVEIVLSKYSKG